MRNDFRYGLRTLRRNPGFAVIAVLTLALGVGANTALFSVVNAVVLRPLPYRDPARLVQLWESNRASRTIRVSHLNFLDWRSQSRSFEQMASYGAEPVTITGSDMPSRITAAAVSRGFFALFRIQAAIGRTFLPEEHQPGEVAAVIGYGLWQRAFGADPRVIGRMIHVTGIPCHVVGVAPPDFRFPDDTELWIPSEVFPDDSARSAHNDFVVGRLKAGISLAAGQAEMDTIARRLEQQYPDSNRGQGVNVVSLHKQLVGKVEPALLILLGAVGFVLLIACANVANLLLARSSARSREIAVRTALGAGRARLIRQLLSESLVLSSLGGAAGLLLALWATSLVALLVPHTVPRANEIAIDAPVLWFTLGISVVTGILFGSLPAMRLSRTGLNDSLKESAGRAATGRTRAGSILVVSELALSLILLVAAGLLMRTFLRLIAVDPGFRAEHVLTARLTLPVLSLNEPFHPQPVLRFYREMLDGLRAMPGVVAAGTTTQLPLGAERDTNGVFDIEGRPPAGENSPQDASYRVISTNYFRALGVPLVRGRIFRDEDAINAPQVAIINQAMARRFWLSEDPLGKRIKFLGMEPSPQWMTIIGVAGDVREFGPAHNPSPAVFVPFTQHLTARLAFPNVVVRVSGEPSAFIPAVRELIRSLNKDAPAEFGSMDALLADSVAQQRFQMRLLALFAALALALAAVGIYGVVSYSISRRTHEIGIRLAIGASHADVVRMVIAEGLRLAAAGIAAGLAGALALHRLLAGMLYGVSAMDFATYLSVSVLLTIVALAAMWIPARRATRVDPLVALRYE
ncbi:MAG TPA: ABC transporter permease [Bryobacteraceae bacterium]|nr:ABC transporter permease [Bryobacteraceae bacterium]